MMPEHLKILLAKMCEIVGADPSTIDFSKQEWYYKHSWTLEQEAEFKNWMINYVLSNKEARQELMTAPSKSRHKTEKLVNEFLFNYGWKSNG